MRYEEKKIFYEIKNESDKKSAIIFIHGSGENSLAWKEQLNDLDLDFSLITMDLPSHDKSDHFKDLSLDLYVDVVKHLINDLKLERTILCGHSLGGAIIQAFYFKYPNDVAGLILCATGARLRVSPAIITYLKNDYQAYLDSIPIGAFYRKTSKKIIDFTIHQASLIKPEVTYQDYLICDKFDSLDKTSSIEVPCLIIVGKGDKLTPPKYSMFFKEKIKNSKLILINQAGHMVMLEKPNEMNAAIKEFILNDVGRN